MLVPFTMHQRNGWFEEICTYDYTAFCKAEMDKKAVKEEALKYKTRKEFGKKCSGAYEVALKKIGSVRFVNICR